jgi:hypothetical protein
VLLVDSPENEAAAMDVDEYRNLARWRRLEVRKRNVDLEDQAFETGMGRSPEQRPPAAALSGKVWGQA